MINSVCSLVWYRTQIGMYSNVYLMSYTVILVPHLYIEPIHRFSNPDFKNTSSKLGLPIPYWRSPDGGSVVIVELTQFLTNQYEVPRLCESKDSLSALITDISCRWFGLKSGPLKDWYFRLSFILTINFHILSIAVHNIANIIKRHIRKLQVLYVQYVLVIITTVIRNPIQGSLDASNFHVTTTHAWQYLKQKVKNSRALRKPALLNPSVG